MATIGQTTVTGGRSQNAHALLAPCRQASTLTGGVANFVGVWCWESAAANEHSMRAALYSADDGALIATSDTVTTPVAVVGGPAVLVQIPFPANTQFPPGGVIFAVMGGPDGLDGNIVVSGSNGDTGVPVWVASASDMWSGGWPSNITGMTEVALARAWDIYLDYTEGAPAAVPVVDSLNDAESMTSTQTGNVLTGENLSGATVAVVQGSVTKAQNVTNTTATTLTFTTVFDAGTPDLKYGSANVIATTAEGPSDPHPIIITAPAGRSFVDLTAPNPTADNRITAVPDLAAGDQLEISNVQGGTIADVNVNSDATFDVDEAVTAFDVRAWDSSDQTWGAVGTQTVGDIPPPPEPPVFDGTIPDRSFVVDVAITPWDLSTYFTGATSYSSAGTLPTGLTLNASTGVLSGTPTTPGTYSGITITGINDDGTDTSNAFTITITDTPPPPAPTKPRRRDGRRRGLLGYIYGRG